MEKLGKNHARFCTKYVRFVGVAFTNRRNYAENLKIDGNEFSLRGYHSRDLEVGDLVYIAKRISTVRGQPQKWEVHQIILAEAYWYYELWEKKTPKEKRMDSRKSYPGTWFGNNTFILTKL